MRFADPRRPLLRTFGVLASACLTALLVAGAAVGVGPTSGQHVGSVSIKHGTKFTINGTTYTTKTDLIAGDTLATSGTNEVQFTVNYKGSASCDTGKQPVKLHVVPPPPGQKPPPVLVQFDTGTTSCTTPKGHMTKFKGAHGASMTTSDPAFVFTVDARKNEVTIKLRKGAATVSGARGSSRILALNPTKSQSLSLATQVMIPFNGAPQQPGKATLSRPEQNSLKAVNGLASTQATPPKLPTAVVKGPPNSTPRQDATFTFSGGSLYACSFDGGGFYACSSPLCRLLLPGPHKLLVQATDAAGNTQKGTTTYSWTIGKSPAPPIVYQSNSKDPTAYQIYTIGPNGGKPMQLTGLVPKDRASFDPALSTDRTLIVFESDRDTNGRSQLFTMKADGSNVQPLLKSPFKDRVPSWSPCGTQIAFARTDQKGQTQIHIVDKSGANDTALVTGPGDATNPAWSPDGTTIVFTKVTSETSSQIAVVSATGGTPTPLTNPPTGMADKDPVFSPDGKKIAFERDRPNLKDPTKPPLNARIWVMNADGTGAKPLTKAKQFEFHPTWSPDGTQIAFAAGNGATTQIVVVSADGTGQQVLTKNTHQSISPNW